MKYEAFAIDVASPSDHLLMLSTQTIFVVPKEAMVIVTIRRHTGQRASASPEDLLYGPRSKAR